MKQININMYRNLRIAMKALEVMSEKDLQIVEKNMRMIISIKYEMEHLAIRRGYSQACRNAIPTCRGECCKYHFPANLTPGDFLAAIYHLPEKKQILLSELLLQNNKNSCPMLMKTGCFFSFEQRPIVCTNAYPCFSNRSYWLEKEKRAIQIKNAYHAISKAIRFRHEMKLPAVTPERDEDRSSL